ncbi:MAG: hypothetical protein H7061_10990 [Bdellovibrionaceae bacterium]|nr:hypothetical protein [Bdellovibrio sp.]
MMKLISTIVLLTLSLSTQARTVKPIYVVHVNLGNTQLSENVVREIQRAGSTTETRPVIVIKPDLDRADNPFAVSKYGFEVGSAFVNGEFNEAGVPVFSAKMLDWFQELENKNIKPEVFIINGHHSIGLGFSSDAEWNMKDKNQPERSYELSMRSLYLPTILKSQQRFAVVKRFFENIKLAFIGGCEGLANLEPKEFGVSGRALKLDEIKERYETGDRKIIVGDKAAGTGLAHYKYDLATTYNEHFTENASDEACFDSVLKRGCQVHHVERILPDSGLWSDSHPYNRPLQMKQLFPKAYAVFGFNTPSPLRPGIIWENTFAEARRSSAVTNILAPILSDEISLAEKRNLVQKLRVAWTKSTLRLNKRGIGNKVVNRVSGSITPAFPELDANGIFAYGNGESEVSGAPKFAPYEIRSTVSLQLRVETASATVNEQATSDVLGTFINEKIKTKPAQVEKIEKTEKAAVKDDLGEFIKKVDVPRTIRRNRTQEINSPEIKEKARVPEIDAMTSDAAVTSSQKENGDSVKIAVPYKSFSGE